MKTGRLYLISAPSGAGKTSLVDAALQQDANLVVSVSHTTRQQRGAETDGVNYHFVSSADFDAMVAAGEFLEHATVFDQSYGTAKAEVEALQTQGKDVILEIDWQGADQVRQVRPDAVSIFILPPSMAVLQQRLQGRGQDSAEAITRRLAEAQLEMAQAPRYHYIVVNDDFERALGDILAIFRASRLDSNIQTRDNPAVSAILSAS